MRSSSSKNLGQARSSVLVRSTNNNNPRSNGSGNAETPSQEAASSTEHHPTFNSMAVDATGEQAEKEDRDQPEWLSKNDDYLINPSVHSVCMTLGCDKGPEMDASVALFDERLDVVDTISHYKPRSTCESVEHSRNVPGERTDEVMSVGLSKIPVYIHYLLFVFCIASDNTSLNEIHSAYVGMMYAKETHQNRKLCRFSVTGMSGHAMIMGVLTRKGPRWNFRALGIPASGRTIHELLQNPKNLECLKIIPSYNPRMRQVTVNVVKGTDLAAKYVLGIVRSPYSASPYFIVTFKNNNYTSEHKPQTLEPEWKEFSFDMGLINEVETEALKVQVFDYNDGGVDTFVGMIRISGCDLYHLGVGDHTFWFRLESSKEETYRHKKVSGKILIHFRIKESLQNFARSLHPSAESEKIDPDPHNSGTRLGIEDNPKGKSSAEYADLGRELVRAIVPIFRKNSVPMFVDPVESTPEEIAGQVTSRSETLLENASTEAIPETEAGERVVLVSTQWEAAEVVDASLELSQGAADSYGTSDGDGSSASEAELWIPDEPFGSRGRLLTVIGALKQGQKFTDNYTIAGPNFSGRPHLRLAWQTFRNSELALLKFYWVETTMENAIEMHSKLATCAHVCSILHTLKTWKTGYPPCIVFEKGEKTLREWLLSDWPDFSDRRWCLDEILKGLMEIHADGIVHCDVKPSNVVFFPKPTKWKFIDFDGAQKAGFSRTICFTAQYAAPEILKGWQKKELPVAQPSSDIWSFGVIAYEVLAGLPMFGDDLSHDKIYKLILEGIVEEKLASIENDSHRKALSNCLKRDPEERWSADEALKHPMFHSDPQTTWTRS